MTFSIVARCRETGMFGVAIASSSPAVSARCPYARAGVGAVSTQNVTDPTLGPALLDLMAGGASARQALDAVVASRSSISYRQLIAVDRDGVTAGFSGAQSLGVYASAEAADAVAAGNLLADSGIPAAMVACFAGSAGPLGDRLLAALCAAINAGGEAGPIHSAGLLLVDQVSWPVADLRVDWDDADPVGRLGEVWRIYAPQLDDYVRRALQPSAAPRFGVPGDT